MNRKKFKYSSLDPAKERLIELGVKSEDFRKALDMFGLVILTADNSVTEYDVVKALADTASNEDNKSAKEVLSYLGGSHTFSEAGNPLKEFPFSWEALANVRARLYSLATGNRGAYSGPIRKALCNIRLKETFNKHGYIILTRSDVNELDIEAALLLSSHESAKDILEKTTYLHGITGSEAKESEEQGPEEEENTESPTEMYTSTLYGSDEVVFEISEETASAIRSIFNLSLVRSIMERMPVDGAEGATHADGQDASLCALDDEIEKQAQALARSIVDNLRSYPENICECCEKVMI